jgi:hypothetical protein
MTLCSVKDFLLYNLLLLSALMLPSNCLAELQTTQKEEILSGKNSISNTFTFKELDWNSSITLNGYKPDYTFYLPIAKHSNTQKAVLHLKMAFSPLLTAGTRVEVLFNQRVVRHLAMPVNPSGETSWDIELPLTQLSKSWQALKFSAYLSSSKTLCDPNIWIYISPESSLTLTSLELPFNGSFSQLPYPFIDPTAVNPVSTLFVLPNNPAFAEIVAQFKIALQLGQLAIDSKVNLAINFIGDLQEKDKKSNLIFIGTSEHLFKDSGGQLDSLIANQDLKPALDRQAGILLINQSPFNPTKGTLLITGKDYIALEKAVSAFLTPEFNSMASGKMAIVDAIHLKKLTKSVGEWYQTTFKELEYSDQSVSGIGRHQLTYNIPLPNDRIPNEASVKTLITAPIFGNIDNSSITLLVNGLKQDSFQLTKEHSAWQTEINTSAMKPGLNKLDYFVDLHFEHERCTRENYDEVWATIYAKTEFKTSFFNSFPLAMLNQLPVPFNSDLTVVIPEQMTKEDISNLSNLFFKFGQLFQDGSVNFNFLGSNEATEDTIRSHNVILFGTPKTNPWIKFAMPYMPVQLNGNTRGLKLPQKQMEISGEQSTGLLELMPSPWSEGFAVLIIAGDSPEALSLATAALIDDKIRMDLKGNIALINSEDSREILNSYDNRYISFKTRLTMSMTNFSKNILYYLGTHPQIFIYLLVLLVPLIIVLRRKK